MGSNRKRIFSNVVSLEAWHDPFQIDQFTSAVYVELAFSEGRIGGEDEDFPFTFRIALKRALVTVSVEQPLKIDRSSIARSIPESQAEMTKIMLARDKASQNLKAGIKMTPAALSAALNAELGSSRETSHEESIKLVQHVPQTLVSPRPIDAVSYAWEMTPSYGGILSGQPWHPVDAPRMSVKGSRKKKHVDPQIKVTVTCALEDILITDIVPKMKSPFLSVERAFAPKPMAVAIQHLKSVLVEAELEPGAMDNRFSDLILALAVAYPE